MIDFQQKIVYNWERKIVSPKDTSPVPIENAKNIIDYIWSDQGLKFPPKVELLPKQSRCLLGDADRILIRLKEVTYTWIIIHELSHSMTSDIEDGSNLHGELFLGIYIQLLSQYLKIDKYELAKSAEEYRLKFKLDAKPLCY